MPSHLTGNSLSRPIDSFFPVWVICFLAVDFILYGFLIPIAAIYIEGTFLYLTNINIGAIGEILLVAFVTFLILSTVFKGQQEFYFWSRFFGGGHQFTRILLIRDVANTASIVYFAYNVFWTIQIICSQELELLSRNLHEGVLFAALHPYFDEDALENLHIKPSYRQDYRNPEDIFKELKDKSDQNPWFLVWTLFKVVNDMDSAVKEFQNLYKLKMMAHHGAVLITYIAQLTAAITKLIYFTSLFNYQRAMNIFTQMKQNGQFPIEELKKNESETDGEVEDVPNAGNRVEIVEGYQNSSTRIAGSQEGGPV